VSSRWPARDKCADGNSIAGSDTVTISLTAIIYHLLSNPDRAAMLTAEVRGSPLGDAPLYRDIQRLPYLDACIREGMRLTTPFAGPLPRLSPPTGLDIGGTHIPPGTVVNVMQCQIHKDGRIFHDPEAFKPERWLDSDRGKELDKYFLGVSKRNSSMPWWPLSSRVSY
jgi:benzoate 4-monooxygenase